MVSYDKSGGLLSFECKNRLEVETEIQIISPDTIETAQQSELRNEKDLRVEVGHGGLGRFSFPFDHDPGEFAIIRRPIYEVELSNYLQR